VAPRIPSLISTSSPLHTIIELPSTMMNNCYYDSLGVYRCYSYNHWYDWGRWILTALVLFVILLVVFSLLCLQVTTLHSLCPVCPRLRSYSMSYRRRRRGARPLFGTGWMPSRGQQPQPAYASEQQQQYAPPPGPPPGAAYEYGNGPQESGVYGGLPQQLKPEYRAAA
jgi:hypothetical protein